MAAASSPPPARSTPKLPPLPDFLAAELAAARAAKAASAKAAAAAGGLRAGPGTAPTPRSAPTSPQPSPAAVGAAMGSPAAAAGGSARASPQASSSSSASGVPAAPKGSLPFSRNTSASTSASSAAAAAAAGAGAGVGATGVRAPVAAGSVSGVDARPRGVSNPTGAKGTFTAAAVPVVGSSSSAGAAASIATASVGGGGTVVVMNDPALAFALARASSRVVSGATARVEQAALDQRLRVLGVMGNSVRATREYLSYGANPNGMGVLPNSSGGAYSGAGTGTGTGSGVGLLSLAIDQQVTYEIVELLVHAGTDVHATDRYGRTPLMLAAMHGHERVVRLLLAHGALPEPCDMWGKTALHHLLECEFNADALQALLLDALMARRDALCDALCAILPPGASSSSSSPRPSLTPRSPPASAAMPTSQPRASATLLTPPAVPGHHARRSSGNAGGWLPSVCVDIIEEYCTYNVVYATAYPLSRHMLTDEQEQLRRDRQLLLERQEGSVAATAAVDGVDAAIMKVTIS